MSLKVGDKVIVIAGKDKGKEGKLLAKKGDKVLVEGINMVKKHIKPNGQDQTGGIVDKEALIHVSNVKLASKTTSDKKKKDKDEKKVRVSSKSKSKKD